MMLTLETNISQGDLFNSGNNSYSNLLYIVMPNKIGRNLMDCDLLYTIELNVLI